MIEYILIPEEKMKKLKKDRRWELELKKYTDVKIGLNDGVTIEGDSFQVLKVKEIIKAFSRGFNFDDTIDLFDDDYALETINITDFVGKSKERQIVIRGRLIGTRGKIKNMIEKFSNTRIAIYGKTVSVIGKWNDIKVAKDAIEMLLGGAKHNTVYRFLEKYKVE